MSDKQQATGTVTRDEIAWAASAAKTYWREELAKVKTEWIAAYTGRRRDIFWRWTREEVEKQWPGNYMGPLEYCQECGRCLDRMDRADRLRDLATTSHVDDIRLTQSDILFLRRWLNGVPS